MHTTSVTYSTIRQLQTEPLLQRPHSIPRNGQLGVLFIFPGDRRRVGRRPPRCKRGRAAPAVRMLAMQGSCLRVKPRDRMLSSAAGDNICGILGFSFAWGKFTEPAVEVKIRDLRKNEPSVDGRSNRRAISTTNRMIRIISTNIGFRKNEPRAWRRDESDDDGVGAGGHLKKRSQT